MMYRELLAVYYNFQLHSMDESKAASKEITWQPSATVVLEQMLRCVLPNLRQNTDLSCILIRSQCRDPVAYGAVVYAPFVATVLCDMFCNILGDSNLILDGMRYYWNLILEVKGTHGLIASPFGAPQRPQCHLVLTGNT